MSITTEPTSVAATRRYVPAPDQKQAALRDLEARLKQDSTEPVDALARLCDDVARVLNFEGNALSAVEQKNLRESVAHAGEVLAFTEVRKQFGELGRAERAAPSFNELAEAIAQLNKSERGRACLRWFNSMLQAYGFGLGSANWTALATLHRAGAAGQQRHILAIQEAMP